MQLSYWEYKTWLSNIDFTIVGRGIVGLSCACHLREKYPKAKILLLEKGILPQGASTKNAGFACFGSISEILSDLESQSESSVLKLVQQRWDGINTLRATLGDTTIDFQQLGGHELFFEHDALYHDCLDSMHTINTMLEPIFGRAAFESQGNRFSFKKIRGTYITQIFEGQIDTGKMMQALVRLALEKNIIILNGITVQSYMELLEGVAICTDSFECTSKKLFVATNGFANTLLQERVRPARAQVLVTEPITNLHVKGTFHMDKGYYYFRNIDNRILLGGGRNLDIEGEETMSFGETSKIQKELERILQEIVLPERHFEIDRRWSGIMGMGTSKSPIIKQISDHVFCGIRLGGMGIAIGSTVGKELAELLD